MQKKEKKSIINLYNKHQKHKQPNILFITQHPKP